VATSVSRWLALGYNIPINPSKNRVYIWRKLKDFGAEYFKQGVAVLPNTKDNYNHFRTLASKIKEMGGEASIVELRFIDPEDELEMIARFKRQTENEYAELKNDIATAINEIKRSSGKPLAESKGDELKRMIKRYNMAKRRDYFRSGSSRELEQGINQLFDILKASATDIGAQLIKILERL